MPFCPNPDCPHRRRAGRPAEYRPGVTACADCGAALVDALPPFPSRARLGWPAPLLARLLLNLSVLFGVWLAGFIPLPGLEPGGLAEARAQGTGLGLLMLGIRPLLVAMVLVELVALALPPTRARRRTDLALRKVLWLVAAALALPIAWVQGLGVALSLEQMTWSWHDYLVVSPGWAFRLGTASLLALATAGLTLLARGLDRHGLGPGLAALLLLDVAVAGGAALWRLGQGALLGDVSPAGVVVGLGAPALFAAAIAWVVGRRPRWARDLPVGLPVTGMLPLEVALLVLMVPGSLATLMGFSEAIPPWLDPIRPASLLPVGLVVLGVSPLAATLFHWRRRAWWRGPERRAWLGLMVVSAALLIAVVLANLLAIRLLPWLTALGALTLVAGTALALDLWDEITVWRRAAGSAPRLFRNDQDLADALEALEALRRADPAGHYVLCGRRFRSLTYFFGPWVPLRLLGVPGEPP